MLLRYSKNVSINIESKKCSRPGAIDVLFLHGFTGSSDDWLPFLDSLSETVNCYTVDLIGHGRSSSPKDISYYTTKSLTDQLQFVIQNLHLKKPVLTGYSMGGRIAIAFAAGFPEMVSGLILESSSPGLVKTEEREKRFQNDIELAKMIEEQGIEKFTDFWLAQPLFATQGKLELRIITDLKNAKLKNNPIGLANSLRGFSTGIMPHLWDNLSGISCKTYLVTGSLDQKFTTINSEMAKLLEKSKHIIINDCGHNVHLEKPEVFIQNLITILSEI